MSDPTQIYSQVSSLVSRIDLRDTAMSLWLTQAANGGVGGNGLVTFTTLDGSTFDFPCFQKLVSQIASGNDARQDVAFFFGANFGANEVLWCYTAAADVSYDLANSFARAETGPTNQAVITILKAPVDSSVFAPWGTITFAAGSKTGVLSVASPTQLRGETLKFIAPAASDLAFTGVSGTLAGAL